MKQAPLLDPDHVSLQQQRLKKYERVNPERIYAAHWKRQNRRVSYVNRGFTLIEWILCPSGQEVPSPVSRRDAAVAASVIQWLGTNCGLGFMRTCEEQIDKARRSDDDKRRRPSLLALEREMRKPVIRAIDI